MKPSPVVVQIDEVRVHGAQPRTRGSLGAAVAHELTQFFSRRPGATSGSIGAGVARAVQRAVRKSC